MTITTKRLIHTGIGIFAIITGFLLSFAFGTPDNTRIHLTNQALGVFPFFLAGSLVLMRVLLPHDEKSIRSLPLLLTGALLMAAVCQAAAMFLLH